MDELALFRETFMLDGDDLVRQSSRQVVNNKPGKRGYIYVSAGCKQFLLHRVKFALHHGYLPPEVDHRDRDPLNNSLENLREASSSLQKHNRAVPSRCLPRGVYRRKSGRFNGKVRENYKNINLGTFDTPEEAHEAVQAWYHRKYGD